MASITQKVALDASDYHRNMKKMTQETKSEMKRVNSEFNESGNAVDDFAERTKRNTKEVQGSLDDLAKGFKAGIGLLSVAGLSAMGGAALAGQLKEGAEFSGTLNRLGVQQGLTSFQQGELRNQLLDVSSRRDVEEEGVASAASTAIAYGAASDEVVKFADVIAGASKLQEGLDPAQLAEDVARDIRARGMQVTAETAQRSIEALLTGARAGFKDIGTALAATTQLEGGVQRRAGLSQRELINLMAGAQLGAGAAPEETQAAVRELVRITDTLEGEALQGVLGAFRGPEDTQGNRQFNLGAKQLEEASKRISQIGSEKVQRQVLGELGFSKQGIEGLLAMIRDRAQVVRQVRRVSADEIGMEEAIESSTDNFLDGVSKFFNSMGNEFKKETTVQVGQIGKSGRRIGLSPEEVEAKRREVSPLAFPALRDVDGPRRTNQGDKVQTATPPKSESGEMKVVVEVDSKDPAFIAKPKSQDLNRSARGL